MSYDNTNSGAAFLKDKTNPRQPDFSGSLNAAGVDYWVSVWVKVSGPNSKTPGQKFLSLALTEKDQQTAYTPSTPQGDPLGDLGNTATGTKKVDAPDLPDLPPIPDDDDIPF